MKPVRIIWHHSGDAYNGDQLAKIDVWHKLQGFPLSRAGYYVGYHYLIERTGDITQCRLDEEDGAHDAGENEGSIGICLAGNFDQEYPSTAQHDALGRLIASLQIRWDIGLADIAPHRAGDSTSCPGANMPDKWAAYAAVNFQAGYVNQAALWISLFLTKPKSFSFSPRPGPFSPV